MKKHMMTLALLAAAGLAGAAAPRAAAQDCRLGVHALDPVLMPGETTQVHVWAHFPASGFAFASAEFDVQASIPSWAVASDGAIAGANVWNIAASQAHMPPAVIADPANPYRVWNGVFAPASYEPALVRIQATPTGFSYYPSDLTPSSVPCDADPGRDFVLINPVAFGPVLAAPGQGTTMQPGPQGVDVLLGGAGDDFLVGVLPPPHVRTRIHTYLAPSEVRIDVRGGGDDAPSESISLNFGRVGVVYEARSSWASAHSAGINVCMSDGSVRFISTGVNGTAWPFALPRLPDTYRFRIENNVPNQTTTLVAELGFDEPFPLQLPGAPTGNVVGLEVRMMQNNLRQLSLGCHTFESHGSPQLALTFEGACAADTNGDGAVDSTDISAFLTLWIAGVQTNTPDTDFNADGQTNSADISAYLAAWLHAVQNGC